MPESRIVLTDIYKTYNGKDVLSIDSAEIPLEGIVAIIGWSGSGKSTLLNILSLIDYPDTDREGIKPKIKIYLPDEEYIIQFKKGKEKPDIIKYDVNKNTDSIDQNKFRRQLFGYVFQEHYLHPNLNIEYNIKTPLITSSKTILNNKLENVCRIMGIDDRLKCYSNQVSGGQAQRASILRSMVKNCPVIFGDELTSNIDYKKSKEILDEFEKALKNGKSGINCFIWASHDIHLIQKYAEKIITIKSGKINCSDNIYKDDDNPSRILALLDDDNPGEKRNGSDDKESENIISLPESEISLLFEMFDLQYPMSCLFPNTNSGEKRNVSDNNFFNLGHTNATFLELIRYYLSYAYKDLFKSVWRPTVDFFVVVLSVTFVILFLLSILKISYGSHKYLELKMSDPRINSLEVMKSEKILELEEKHFIHIQELLGDSVRYVTPIYKARISIMDVLRRLPQSNALTFRKDDPIIREILGDKNHPFVSDSDDWKGLIIKKSFADSIGYKKNRKSTVVKFNYYNNDATENIPVIIIDTPLPFNGRIMLREEFYIESYKNHEQEKKPELSYVTVYPKNIYDTIKIKNKIENTGLFEIRDALKVLNKIRTINEIEAQTAVFVKLSLISISIISLLFIGVTIYRNLYKKRREMGVFLAYGMKRFSFFIFYLCEAMIISICTFMMSCAIYMYCIEPMINERLSRGSLLKIMGTADMNTVISFEALKLPMQLMIYVYGGTYLLLLILFLYLIYSFTSQKPVKLMKEL